MLKKDSRFRFRHLESKKDSDESELEEDMDICTLLLQNVHFPKQVLRPKQIKAKPKSPFSEFYSQLNSCRRESRATNAKLRQEQMTKKGVQSSDNVVRSLEEGKENAPTPATTTAPADAAAPTKPAGLLKAPNNPDKAEGKDEQTAEQSKNKKTVKFQIEGDEKPEVDPVAAPDSITET